MGHGYESIDGVIREWAQRYKFTLFDAIGNVAVRTIYLSSQRGECFQIWIDPPHGGSVALHAGEVETRDDEMFLQDWRVPVQDLAAALDQAVTHVHGWMRRP